MIAPASSTSAVPSRPGYPYFAPEARLMRLSGKAGAAEKGEEIADIRGDILRLEVTRVNDGAGQYSVTLNNWDDILPSDRKRLKEEGKPALPRYKYNDFQTLVFGTRLRLDLRYWPSGRTEKEGGGWIPMIAGPITDMKFTFSPQEGARLVVSGEDDLKVLQAKNPKKVRYSGKSEEGIIRDVLQRANTSIGTSLALKSTEGWPGFATNDSQALAEAHLEGQSYLEYIQKFADRMDFEVYLEFASLDDAGSAVEFHFEPSRARLDPDPSGFVLEREKNLLDFTPTIKVAEQFTKATVKGRHRVRTRPVRVKADVGPDILKDELPVADEGASSLSGPEWRKKLFGDNPDTQANQTNLDEDRARTLAEAHFRRKAREFLVIQGSTLGLPRLRPGQYIELKGVKAPFDGLYYVTQTVHSFGEDGLRTRFTARRPGMPAPANLGSRT
jgi:hypothetical protein